MCVAVVSLTGGSDGEVNVEGEQPGVGIGAVGVERVAPAAAVEEPRSADSVARQRVDDASVGRAPSVAPAAGPLSPLQHLQARLGTLCPSRPVHPAAVGVPVTSKATLQALTLSTVKCHVCDVVVRAGGEFRGSILARVEGHFLSTGHKDLFALSARVILITSFFAPVAKSLLSNYHPLQLSNFVRLLLYFVAAECATVL